MRNELVVALFLELTIGAQLASANHWCVPGWNATCGYRGTCDPITNVCQCDKLPYRCGSQIIETNVFDYNTRCATIIDGCYYEVTQGGEVKQRLCNGNGCCKSLSEETGQSGEGYDCM